MGVRNQRSERNKNLEHNFDCKVCYGTIGTNGMIIWDKDLNWCSAVATTPTAHLCISIYNLFSLLPKITPFIPITP